MKYILITSIFCSLIFFSCKEKKEKTTQIEKTVLETLPLADTTANGLVKEYYNGTKQIKIKGNLDKNKLRHGIWYFFNEKGEERSMTPYIHGKKEGFTVVKHPNGIIHYRGEYHADSMVGEWKFYTPKGILETVKNY